MMKLKILLTAILSVALLCGCMVNHGEAEFIKTYNEIVLGKDGTTYMQIFDELGEGKWSPFENNDTTFLWQHGYKVFKVTFDDNAHACVKAKNW